MGSRLDAIGIVVLFSLSSPKRQSSGIVRSLRGCQRISKDLRVLKESLDCLSVTIVDYLSLSKYQRY